MLLLLYVLVGADCDSEKSCGDDWHFKTDIILSRAKR